MCSRKSFSAQQVVLFKTWRILKK